MDGEFYGKLLSPPIRPFDFPPTTTIQSVTGCCGIFEHWTCNLVERTVWTTWTIWTKENKEAIMPEPLVLEVFSDFVW